MPNYLFSFVISLALLPLAFVASHMGEVHVAVVFLFFVFVFVGLGLFQLQREDSASL